MKIPTQIQAIAIRVLKLKNDLVYRPALINGYKKTRHTIDLNKVLEYNNHRPYGYQRYICNAPFTSLYFGVRGEVIACCKNRKQVLGYIQQRTIDEIWHGKEAGELRDAIANNNLDTGCSDCQQGILAKNYASVMALSYDSLQADKALPYPKRMDFELSGTCNLACIMCNGYLSSTYRKHFENAAPRPDVYDHSFLKQLLPYLPHLQKANFYGGEPFLVDLNYDIWEAILDKNPACTIFIQTNGHILNNKVRCMLEKGKFHFGISLESLKKETFENIRLFGQFDKLIRNIDYFREYCRKNNTHFSLAITPLRHTILELPDFVRFANSLNAFIYFNILTEPHDLSLWALEEFELKKMEETLQRAELPEKTPAEKNNNHQYLSYLNQIRRWREEAGQRAEKLTAVRELTTNQILSVLMQKLEDFATSAGNVNTGEIPGFIKDMKQKMEALSVNDPDQYRNKLEFFCSIPDERFIYEFIMNTR